MWFCVDVRIVVLLVLLIGDLVLCLVGLTVVDCVVEVFGVCMLINF